MEGLPAEAKVFAKAGANIELNTAIANRFSEKINTLNPLAFGVC